ncbi:GMC oxidoreductase [Brevibacillus dissolubilis]|uniref:GMC oxidoreductase n=1 Tax=Brevibacillus dissolubilis TaxID=1844116 RepID=UPI00111665B0|nr:GMC family oxidoreductase [Brevibacillus dissolubilis]
MQTHFDAVIIGSGAGGAPIAHTLAKAGKTVLVLEKGPLFLPQQHAPSGVSDYKRDELLATGAEKRITLAVANRGQSYYASHVEPDLNDEPHIYRETGKFNRRTPGDYATIEGYTAHVVGGGTQLYGAVSLRFSETDFQLHSYNEQRTDLKNDPNDDVRREARDWPLSYQDFLPWYEMTERLIGINGTSENQAKPFRADYYQTPLDPNPISGYIAKGMDALGMKRFRTPLAVITEDHEPSGRKVPRDPDTAKTGYVNRYGDPLGLKSNTWVSLLAPIKDLPNIELRANCTVTQLESDGYGNVNRVQYRDPSGTMRTVSGKVVIVACSAIESVRLLKVSALANHDFDRRIHQNDLLGKYFLTHCFGGARVRVPERFDKSLSLDSDWATEFCATDDYLKSHGLWAGAAIYNNTSDSALPISLARTLDAQDMDTIWKSFTERTELTGDQLLEWLKEDFGTTLSVAFMANQVPLYSNRIELHPTIRDKWGMPSAYIIKDWHSHDVALMDTIARECARILEKGCDLAEGSVQGGGVYLAENGLARIANHILGGARFGKDRRDSVLDVNCRAWDFDNLYVTDGSFMPTSGGANPTHTIEANAFRVAHHLLGRL